MSIVILIISILLSVLSAIISSKFGFDIFRSIATGILTFIGTEIISISWYLGNICFEHRKEKKFIKKTTPYSLKIQEINDFYNDVERDSQGEKDLFSLTCSKAIDNLYVLLKNAAEEKKVEITSDYIVNVSGVFEALNVTCNKKIRLTFPIKSIEGSIIPTAEDRKFFETIFNKINNGEVSELLILIILDKEELLQNPQMELLLKFYAKNKNYKCKYILSKDFIEACEHNRISTTSLDFGIYGPKMLFVEESLTPYKGTYYKDTDIIKRYTNLFDEVWNFEAITHNNPQENANGQASSFTPKQFFDELYNLPNA